MPAEGRSSRGYEMPNDESASRSSRVRGPAEVKSARDSQADDDCLPPGAQKADFKTLQEMIARGIQDAETGAVELEADIPAASFFNEDEEERRFKERQRQRREQEAMQREKEREQARQKRRREQEERERRQAEELEREEQEETSLKEARAQSEAQCRKELAAAVRIQARIRGRRSRAGKANLTPHSLKSVLHWEPYIREQ